MLVKTAPLSEAEETFKAPMHPIRTISSSCLVNVLPLQTFDSVKFSVSPLSMVPWMKTAVQTIAIEKQCDRAPLWRAFHVFKRHKGPVWNPVKWYLAAANGLLRLTFGALFWTVSVACTQTFGVYPWNEKKIPLCSGWWLPFSLNMCPAQWGLNLPTCPHTNPPSLITKLCN